MTKKINKIKWRVLPVLSHRVVRIQNFVHRLAKRNCRLNMRRLVWFLQFFARTITQLHVLYRYWANTECVFFFWILLNLTHLLTRNPSHQPDVWGLWRRRTSPILIWKFCCIFFMAVDGHIHCCRCNYLRGCQKVSFSIYCCEPDGCNRLLVCRTSVPGTAGVFTSAGIAALARH